MIKSRRVGKYMVYNPRRNKPVRYIEDFDRALNFAKRINLECGDDILIIKVVANVENNTIKICESQLYNNGDEIQELSRYS